MFKSITIMLLCMQIYTSVLQSIGHSPSMHLCLDSRRQSNIKIPSYLRWFLSRQFFAAWSGFCCSRYSGKKNIPCIAIDHSLLRPLRWRKQAFCTMSTEINNDECLSVWHLPIPEHRLWVSEHLVGGTNSSRPARHRSSHVVYWPI